MQRSKFNNVASIVTLAIAIAAASLMTYATVDTAIAGKGTDSTRAPAPRAASTTTTGVSPHIKAINQTKMWRGNKVDESCGTHCRDHGDDHHHQH